MDIKNKDSLEKKIDNWLDNNTKTIFKVASLSEGLQLLGFGAGSYYR